MTIKYLEIKFKNEIIHAVGIPDDNVILNITIPIAGIDKKSIKELIDTGCWTFNKSNKTITIVDLVHRLIGKYGNLEFNINEIDISVKKS